jgi:hypothetical protein
MAGRRFPPFIRRPPKNITLRYERDVIPRPDVTVIAVDFRVASSDRATAQKGKNHHPRQGDGKTAAKRRFGTVHGCSFAAAG